MTKGFLLLPGISLKVPAMANELNDLVYEHLAEALDKLANGFPRTSSNAEIRLLKKIFSNEEASLACQLSGSMESCDIISERVGLSAEQAEAKLTKMAEKGMLWDCEEEGKRLFRLAPFIVGIYEASSVDHELAHLVEEYLANGGAAGIMKPQPAIHRVVPANKATKSEWILPYDDVKALLMGSKSFSLRDCVCRVQQKHMGHECSFPLRTCLSFSAAELPSDQHSVSKEEALVFLNEAEELGLVHTVSNVMKGVGYVCNCCGCCCGLLRGITDWGIENSVAHANYYADIDAQECVGCGTCIERCQVQAISEDNEISVVDREKCIGCGLCVTGCPNGAARLERKSDKEIVSPPVDFETWEHQRLRNRGLTR
jgi:electron transport complex protein RnfB